jgi:hypothetical protein
MSVAIDKYLFAPPTLECIGFGLLLACPQGVVEIQLLELFVSLPPLF